MRCINSPDLNPSDCPHSTRLVIMVRAEETPPLDLNAV